MAELLRTFLPVILWGLLAGFFDDVSFEHYLGLFAACLGLEDDFKFDTFRLETDLVAVLKDESIVRVLATDFVLSGYRWLTLIDAFFGKWLFDDFDCSRSNFNGLITGLESTFLRHFDYDNLGACDYLSVSPGLLFIFCLMSFLKFFNFCNSFLRLSSDFALEDELSEWLKLDDFKLDLLSFFFKSDALIFFCDFRLFLELFELDLLRRAFLLSEGIWLFWRSSII